MKKDKTVIDDTMNKTESEFKNASVHDLLLLVGGILHDTIDYSHLFNKIYNYIEFRNLYLDAKLTTLEEDLQNIDYDETSDIFYHQMSLNKQEVDIILLINTQQTIKLQEIAKRALEFAVKKSTTKAELLQCAKYIEWEIYDRDWAQEIRKKAYGDNWNPTDNEELDRTSRDYDSFIEENKADLVQFFRNKEPAAYRNSSTEAEE